MLDQVHINQKNGTAQPAGISLRNKWSLSLAYKNKKRDLVSQLGTNMEISKEIKSNFKCVTDKGFSDRRASQPVEIHVTW